MSKVSFPCKAHKRNLQVTAVKVNAEYVHNNSKVTIIDEDIAALDEYKFPLLPSIK